jgi:DnaJ family protein A protein 2
VSEKKTFEVAIEPGARHGQKIVLRGEAGVSEPGLEPGDVVLLVAQKEHAVFQRMRHNSQDLVIQKSINLRDALCGVSFTVKHLDGRLLHITSPPGEVVRPGSFQVVADEGMPFPGRPYVKGHLYINFQVGHGGEGRGAGAAAGACGRAPCERRTRRRRGRGGGVGWGVGRLRFGAGPPTSAEPSNAVGLWPGTIAAAALGSI